MQTVIFTISQKLKRIFLQLCHCFIGEVENAEERTERAKACPCPVHARRGRKVPKDRLRVQFSFNQTSTSSSTYF